MEVSGIVRMGYNDNYIVGKEIMNLSSINSEVIRLKSLVRKLKWNRN